VNNRILLREVYDKRLLHDLLGIAPIPLVVVPAIPNTTTTQGKSPTTVAIIRDGSLDREKLLETIDESLPHQPRSPGQDSDESGKYDIKKRRTSHRHRASHSPRQPEFFTTDDEDSVDEEEDSYEVGVDDSFSDDESRTRSRMSRRRSYWLSKGIGAHSDDNSS